MLLVNRILLILNLVFLPVVLEATPVFTLGNEAYQNKDFPQAINLYKESLKTTQSFSQYFNLGNAYYENKEYGHAILEYERALAIKPGDGEALKNLKKAYDVLKISPERVGSIEVLAHMFSAGTWTWIAIIVVLVGLMAFCFQLYVSKGRGVAKTIMWSCVVLSVFLVGVNIFYVRQARWGIVYRNEAKLRISPTNASPVMTLLLEGTKARVIKTKGREDGFVLVKTLDNKEGWMSMEDFGLIRSVPWVPSVL